MDRFQFHYGPRLESGSGASGKLDDLLAFANAPVGGVHALAYPLGGRFHAPHGLANALMLPHVLQFNVPAAMSLYAELAPIIDPVLADLGQQARTAGLIEDLRALFQAAGLPRRLQEVGVASEDIGWLESEAMRQGRLLQNNPRRISEVDARSLYEAAL